MYICLCFVCMCGGLCTCMYMCIYVGNICIVRTFVCIYVCLYVCVYMMYVCACTCMCVYAWHICMYIGLCVFTCVCFVWCIYVCADHVCVCVCGFLFSTQLPGKRPVVVKDFGFWARTLGMVLATPQLWVSALLGLGQGRNTRVWLDVIKLVSWPPSWRSEQWSILLGQPPSVLLASLPVGICAG